ncbi:MAG: DUF3300 domain-containing protein [Fibrobacter sp.]|nr:DUF3300 domain-containing protein [Fibrobacter sp.]
MMKLAQKGCSSRWTWLLVAIFLLLPVSARAAENFSSSELDTLVSTIALYPDPLLVHVLAASTYGEQIPGANEWAQAHKNLSGEDLAREMERANLPYDPSVQALIPFPTVLATMAKYRTWSDQLGDAVSVQKDDVMDAVQRLRNAAYDHGQLRTDEQVRVEKGTSIVIEPVRTEYVYVPVYNPRVVFYVFADYPAIRYHHYAWLGSWYGEWGWGSCWFEWDSHFMYVRDYRWYHRRPIPHHPRRYNPPPRRLEPVHSAKRPSAAPVAESKWNRITPPARREGGVFGRENHTESTRPVQAPVGHKSVPVKDSFAASAGNSSKKSAENEEDVWNQSSSPVPSSGISQPSKRRSGSSEYQEDNGNSGFGNYTRKSSPGAPSSGGGAGGFSKSKRR